MELLETWYMNSLEALLVHIFRFSLLEIEVDFFLQK